MDPLRSYRNLLLMFLPFVTAASPIEVFYSSPRANGIYATDGATSRTILSNVQSASGFAIGPDGNFYVSEEGGDKLDRYSPQGVRIGTVFGAGRRYTSLTFGPDRLLYVNSETDNYRLGYVRRYDPITGAAAGSEISTTDPAQFTQTNSATYSEGLAFGPDGNLYCPSRHTASVDVYQGPFGAIPGALVTQLTGGLTTTGKIAFGPDGAFYMSEDNGKVLRYDGHSFTTFASSHLGLPSGIAFGPTGDMYVADVTGSDIARFQGPAGAKPGAFIDIFAHTPQPPDDLIIVPEPAVWAFVFVGFLALKRRSRGTCGVAILLLGLPLVSRADVQLYVSDFSGGRILRTDGKTTTTLTSGLYQPMAEAFGPDGKLYVAEQSGQRIDHLSAAGKPIGSRFGTGSFHTGLAFGPDGDIYTAATDSSFLSGVIDRFDPATGAPAGSGISTKDPAAITLALKGSYFEGLAFGPDGNLYASSHYAKSVLVYEGPMGTHPGTLVATLAGVDKPVGLAFGPDGKLYAAEQDRNQIVRWDGSGFSVFASGPKLITPIGIGFGPDGDLYVANYSGRNVARFDGPDGLSPGSFISTFATNVGNPGYLLVVPEPAGLLVVAAMMLVPRRRHPHKPATSAQPSFRSK